MIRRELVCDSKLCLFVEEVSFLHIECKSDRITGLSCCTRINSCCNLSSVNIEVQEYFSTKKLVNFNYGVHWFAWRCLKEHLRIMDILRTDTKNNFLSNIAFVFQDFSLSCRNNNLMLTTDL